MKNFKKISIIILLLALTQCKTTPIPTMQKNSAIGITMEVPGPRDGSINTIYFVKIDKDGNPFTQTTLIPSNYTISEGRFLSYNKHHFLFNAEPGRYAAVLAYKTGHYHKDKYSKYNFFLSKELIKLTEVIVNPGEFAYMGDYVITSKFSLSEYDRSDLNDYNAFDEAQLHYHNIINPDFDKQHLLIKILLRDTNLYYKKAIVHSAKRDKNTETAFLNEIISTLGDSEWREIISNRLKSLNSSTSQTPKESILSD